MSVGIAENAKTVFAKGYGKANLNKQTVVTKNTLFRIASISKVFTALSILQLEEKGKLKISDPVSKYLPKFKSSVNKGISKITIKQLLTHTSKITRDGYAQMWDNDIYPTKNEVYQELKQPNHFTKSKHKFKYSNYGYSVLGLIIEEVSGLSYEKYLQKNILKPLRMDSTKSIIDKQTSKKLATGYGLKSFPEFKIVTFTNPETNAFASATGLSSNVIDLVKFGVAILKHDPKLLSKKGWKKAFSKQYIVDKELRNLIMFGEYVNKNIIWGHGGGFQGFTTRLSIDQKNNLVITCLINQIHGKPNSISKGVHQIIMQWLKIKEKTKQFKPTSKVADYVGLYKGRWGLEAIIPAGNKLLALNPYNLNNPIKEARLLESIGKDKFITHDSDPYDSDQEFMEFKRNKNNKVIGFDTGGAGKTKIL